MGGRSASTCVVSPYRGPVVTGKPGIWLAPSCFGFSQSPLPALCRQDTSYAWRSRLRKTPDRRSERGRRRVQNRSPRGSLGTLGGPKLRGAELCQILWAALAAQVARTRSKAAMATEQRRAPNVTYSVLWRTCVRQVIQFIAHSEHHVKARKLVSD